MTSPLPIPGVTTDPSTPNSVTCVSWNIHRGRGGDGRVDAARVLDVLKSEVWQSGADALFLQEADDEAPPHRGVLDIDRIEADTGLRYTQLGVDHRSTLESHGFLGVVAFLHPRWHVQSVRLVDLPGHCPRGAVIIDAAQGDRALRFCATHLSLSQGLRIAQMRTLGQHFRRHDPRQTIICGDLNEWRPWGGAALSRKVLMDRFTGPTAPTFPVRQPVLPLDRVLTNAPGRVTDLRVLDGPGIRAASDHRPIYGRISLGA
ncbi:endonuclease/exonuclease/phosphatase family protein [Gymnodinialimonas mytili]|uniref:endonuclease/exonuclease/phosphatase family protein n=1 Tax=Gymnodinialimonas mytili TaxID=3126503 RepID=UPI0030EF0A89